MKSKASEGKLQIIDCEAKGNVVRFKLGEPGKDYWGDDWNDIGCMDPVYSEYVKGTKEKSFPFDWTVLTPDFYESYGSRGVSKEMMQKRAVPCLVVLSPEAAKEAFGDFYGALSFEEAAAAKNARLYYFGDLMRPDPEKPAEKPQDAGDKPSL